MLKALQLGNFKSWREVNAELAPITGFFGTNSSGKSSLLQALLLMKQSSESTNQKQVLDFGTDKSLVMLGSFENCISNHDMNQKITLGIRWDVLKTLNPNNRIIPFEIPIMPGEFVTPNDSFSIGLDDFGFKVEIKYKSNNLSVSQFLYDYGSSKFGVSFEDFLPLAIGFEKKLNAHGEDFINKNSEFTYKPRRFYGFPETVIIGNIGINHSLESLLEYVLQKIHYLGPLREPPSRDVIYVWSGSAPSGVGKEGEYTIGALMASRIQGIPLESHIAEKLKELKLIDSFRLEEMSEGTNWFRVLVRRTPESPEVSLTDVGFGVSQVLPVLVLCYYVPEGSTILLEQPELHLHPSVQSGLADIFIDAYQKRGVQIILESHSEHLLRRLQRRIAEEQILPSDVNLYFCSLEKGESKLEALELDEYGNIHSYPKDFFGDRFEEMAAMTEKAIERRAKKALELK